ncbi:MAG: UDP-N-acetylmuramate dehydrogenase [Pseudonocardia sp.]
MIGRLPLPSVTSPQSDDVVSLAGYTTLRLGGPTRRLVEASTAAELVDVVRAADSSGEPLLVLGDGSNVVIGDDGVPGGTVRIGHLGTRVERAADDEVLLTVQAGENWDSCVAASVADGLGGLECLSGIPGRVGAVPVQNVGAYGVEIAGALVDVDLYDRRAAAVREHVPAAELGLGYRTSALKGFADRIVLRIRLRLRADGLSAPITYAELAATLGVTAGDRVPAAEARAAVLELRRGKGMVLDASDHDTWSVGSFFTNPVLPDSELAGLNGLRRWPARPGWSKLAAAALVQKAGFTRGHPGPGGRVALSSKHVLALTHRGGGSTADLLELAREVRDGVHAAFGVTLHPEPVLVGCQL